MGNNEEMNQAVVDNSTNSTAKIDKTKQNQKQDKIAAKPKKVKEKKGNFLVKSVSELKKVSWPSFKTVVKQTSIVIVVVLAFLLVIFGLDKLCSWLVGLICS